MKAGDRWSNKSFACVLELLKDILLESNEFLDFIYKVKKILFPLCIDYKNIHACPNNDYILYWKEYNSLDECPKCGVSHNKIEEEWYHKDYRGFD